MMPPVLAPLAVPIVGWVVAAALVLGGGASWWIRGVEVGHLKNALAALELSNRQIEAENKEKADATTAMIQGLGLELVAARAKREIVTVEVIREVKKVSSPTALCLRAPVVGVLNRRAGGAAGQGEDPRPAAGAAAAPAADSAGPRVRRGTSEQAMSTWTVKAQANDAELRAQITALTAAIRALPNVEIVP